MTGNLQKADAAGKLELADKSAPVTYDVTVGGNGRSGGYVVQISVSAPRDWLLARGFRSDATLIRQDGAKVLLHREGGIDVGDSVSIELIALDDSCTSETELRQRYPELRV